MRRLFPFLKKYKKEAVLAPLFKLLEALMDLLVPLVVAYAIDEGTAAGRTDVLTGCFILLAGLALAGMAFSFTAQFFAAKAAVGFASDLRQEAFDHILSFSYSQDDEIGADTLTGRLTGDIDQLQTGVNLSLRLLLRSPFIVFGAMIMAFTIDVRSAMVFAIAIPLLTLVVCLIMYLTIPLFIRAQNALDHLLSVTREDLEGARVIRAFRMEERQIKDFDESSSILTRLSEKAAGITAVLNPLTYVIVNIATIALIATGAARVDAGLIRQGDLVALYNYMAQIIVELIKLVSLMITINRALASGRRVASLLDTAPAMRYADRSDKEKDGEKAIIFENVSFAYEGSAVEALYDVSFELKKGQTLGIIGPTGSGKSTLVDLMPRFYDAGKGRILIEGIDVREWPKEELLSVFGIVPQKSVLFKGTVRDNLKWGREDASDEELFKALELAQALEIVENRKEGLDSQVLQGGKNFSGGQRQRLCIARALVKRPDILILDDSASALDMATDRKLRTALADLEDMNVVIVSQRCSSIREADLILVLEDGKIIGKGDHDGLLRDCPVYQEIYYSQYPKGDEKLMEASV